MQYVMNSGVCWKVISSMPLNSDKKVAAKLNVFDTSMNETGLLKVSAKTFCINNFGYKQDLGFISLIFELSVFKSRTDCTIALDLWSFLEL